MWALEGSGATSATGRWGRFFILFTKESVQRASVPPAFTTNIKSEALLFHRSSGFAYRDSQHGSYYPYLKL